MVQINKIEDSEIMEIIHENYRKTRNLIKQNKIRKYNRKNIRITVLLLLIDIVFFLVTRLWDIQKKEEVKHIRNFMDHQKRILFVNIVTINLILIPNTKSNYAGNVIDIILELLKMNFIIVWENVWLEREK